jgi:hypothetical protein
MLYKSNYPFHLQGFLIRSLDENRADDDIRIESLVDAGAPIDANRDQAEIAGLCFFVLFIQRKSPIEIHFHKLAKQILVSLSRGRYFVQILLIISVTVFYLM